MNSHGRSNEVAKFVLDALNSLQWSLQIMNLLFFHFCTILYCRQSVRYCIVSPEVLDDTVVYSNMVYCWGFLCKFVCHVLSNYTFISIIIFDLMFS